ncbi:hypothetical protein GCM10027592_17540 [Spirosoma flavus]
MSLQIKHAGYRPQNIAIQLPKGINTDLITVLLPLVSVDKQSLDKPYMQTEQTSYVQSDFTTTDSLSKTSQRVQHDTFMITDAIQNKPLSATVCFFYTKTGAKKCIKSGPDGSVNVNFQQKDIVALEVNATGYQPYVGNMLIEHLDGRTYKHEIRLQRNLTILTVNAPNAYQCELLAKKQTILLSPLVGYDHQFVAYDLLPKSFELIVSYPTQKVKQPMRLHTGLNFTTVLQPQPNSSDQAFINSKTKTSTSGMTELGSQVSLILPDSIPIIYFEQGSYQLRSDSQAVLVQVADYLKKHASYTLQITGHTDNVGNPQINQTLSLYRARATATFLTSKGIPEHRLVKEGIGSIQPIVPNTTEANRVLNRRVSLKLITAQ